MALLTTIEEFKKHVPVNNLTDIVNIMPDILLAEDEHIVKLLGAAFYEELLTKLADETLTDLQKKLLVKLHGAIANLAMIEYLPLNQVQISDTGIHIQSDSMQKTAFQWQINDLMASFKRKGYNALEKVLEFLEEHIDHADFTLWANSAAVTQSREYFINSVEEFQKYYGIGSSRLTFMNLLPIMGKQETMKLEPLLGYDFFDEIKEQLKDRDLSNENEKLLKRFIRPALAHLVVAKALQEQSFKLSPDGIEITLARIDNSNSKESEAGADGLLEAKRQAALLDAQAYLVKLKIHLNTTASADKYATYFNSDQYTAPSGAGPVVFTNSDDTKTFGFF